MRNIMVFCWASLVSAQYNYGPGINIGGALEVSNTANLHLPAQPVAEEYNKVFYSYSAPEQAFEDVQAEDQMTTSIKKNLRVIFIKSPENNALEKATLQLAKTASTDYTAIYVLSKQSDIGSLATRLQEIKSQHSEKPEVHFVKYRTQADAENAQRVIQAQYDSIRGTSSNNGHDTAAVLNFASKSDIQSSQVSNINATAPVISRARPTVSLKSSSRNSYLPPVRRY